MQCPHCGAKASIYKMLMVSKWNNFICKECEKPANRKTMNVLTVYASALVSVLLLKSFLTSSGITVNTPVVAILLLVSLIGFEKLMGKLIKVE